MSAVVSIETPSAVFIVTDGAIYNADNVLLSVRRKVDFSENVPVAVATRGNQGVGDYAAKLIIDAVERLGFDEAMTSLAEVAHKFGGSDRHTRLEVTIAGISEQHGPRRLVFRTDADPVALEYPGVASSCATSSAGLSEMGIRLRGQFEGWESYLRQIAVPMMEHYRRTAIDANAGEKFGQPAHLVGGQVDFTILSHEGVTVETIHRWDDKIGERIDPFTERRTVQQFPRLNRQQRRAAQREQRRGAA
ncbi:hypothetical protein [Rhizobium sp. BK602]|uniref:hypothetical protein n=1 Tax=Rhizobium sp. BK602 TaxID=2586986 RepID=UPI001613014A|nr:hypothetical protein [Rhizobium sp. BK602]MBB3610971.1 hypothetical protein [Rhizobium sp. BK602]